MQTTNFTAKYLAFIPIVTDLVCSALTLKPTWKKICNPIATLLDSTFTQFFGKIDQEGVLHASSQRQSTKGEAEK